MPRHTGGVECPECGGTKFDTKESRPSELFGGCVRRRKECRNCGEKLRTVEIDEVVAEIFWNEEQTDA